MTAVGVDKQANKPKRIALLMIGVMALPIPAMAQLPTLQPVAPTIGQATQGSSETAYTLGAGDRVRLDIINVPEYSGEYQVLIDGTLNLPVIGSVAVQGMTLQQASQVISGKYARFVRRPVTTLSLLAPRPVKIGVSGEVNRPGSYTVTLAEGRQFPTVTQAIQLAGGITQAANVRQIQIRRRTSATQREQVLNVNLMALMQTGDLNQDVTLRDGDSVFIPTTTDINPNETRQLATASFAPKAIQPLKIAIVGEVFRPGSYTVTADINNANSPDALTPNTGNATSIETSGTGNKPPTVTKAIEVAGGITASANIRQIQLRRSTRNGSEQVINVDLWQLLQAGDLSQDVILQDGDTIVVPVAGELDPAEATELASASFSPSRIRVNVVGEVFKPGVIDVQPNTPLNQALLAAGGFTNRARKGSVELVRLNPNGTVSKRQVEVDFAEDIDEANNPTLRNNDVVVVRRSTLARFSDTLGTVLSPIGGIFSLFNFFRIFR